jgi:hypothetical protein
MNATHRFPRAERAARRMALPVRVEVVRRDLHGTVVPVLDRAKALALLQAAGIEREGDEMEMAMAILERRVDYLLGR